MEAYAADVVLIKQRQDREWEATIPPPRPPGLSRDRRITTPTFKKAMACHWLGVVINKDVFLKSLELLPTQQEGVYARYVRNE